MLSGQQVKGSRGSARVSAEGFAALEIVPGTNNLAPFSLQRGGEGTVNYRCEATSVAGFVQQLAVSYIGHGYWFYVTGCVPDGKDPRAVDAKLIERYGIDVSKWARARRKRAGLANVHYLRYQRFFALLATKGEHRFFQEEPRVKDVRRDSVRFEGYSIGYKRDATGKWHPSVRLHPDRYRELKCHLLELGALGTRDSAREAISRLGVEPYAPVRTQLLSILRAVNSRRREAGLEAFPVAGLGLRRRPVAVFAR